MRDAALPYQRNYAITVSKVYVSHVNFAAMHDPHIFSDTTIVHCFTQSEAKILRSLNEYFLLKYSRFTDFYGNVTLRLAAQPSKPDYSSRNKALMCIQVIKSMKAGYGVLFRLSLYTFQSVSSPSF
jgi:hypothetical protein